MEAVRIASSANRTRMVMRKHRWSGRARRERLKAVAKRPDTKIAAQADILRAHARLASIDSTEAPERLLLDVLEALMAGAGHSRGLALDPKRPAYAVASRFIPDVAAIGALWQRLAESDGFDAISASTLLGVFPAGDGGGPR